MQVVTAASFSHNTPQKGLTHNAERPFQMSARIIFASSVLRFVCVDEYYTFYPTAAT